MNTLSDTRIIHKAEQSAVSARRNADDLLRAAFFVVHLRKSQQKTEASSLFTK